MDNLVGMSKDSVYFMGVKKLGQGRIWPKLGDRSDRPYDKVD